MPRSNLPDKDEPLQTRHGEVHPLSNGRTVVEVPSNRQAVAIIEGTRRRLSELPVAPKTLNPVACVCLYTMYGLDAQEIAIATGLSIDQINGVRMSNEYAIMQRAVVDTVMQTETGEVKDYIKKASHRAAKKVSELVESPFADIALRASKDVLDRSGLRPADVLEIHGRMDMGLVIEVVDRRKDADRPTIDMEE